ncbi:MAG: hypothetical protein AAGJ40_05660 [Planctomycetota bacterium]
MKFEDLQVIWSTMDEEPSYAIDPASMRSIVEKKTRRLNRTLDRLEWTGIGVALSTSVILPLDAWREDGGIHQYVVAAVCAVFGTALLIARFGRGDDDLHFDDSLKGIVERSLAQIDRYLRGLRWCYWGFHLPVACVGLIGLTAARSQWSFLVAGGVVGITLISYLGVRSDADQKLAEREDLSNLLEKLNARPDEPAE